MKSTIIASALMASMALAAPVNKRAYATQTHTVVETVMVYTTVWDSPAATQAPAATSSPAAFFEQPSSAAAVTSSEAAPEVPSSTAEVIVSTPAVSSSSAVVEIPSSSAVVEIPSSSVVAEVPSSSAVPEVAETPSPTPTPTPTPTPAPVTSEAAPSSTAPAEAASTEAASTESSSSGASYTGSLTMNYYNNGLGACGTSISDTDMIAALSIEGFGASTYDTATGNPTNKWCNQKIRVTYNGVSADATIMDRCAGCTGEGGLDATPALWKALTGGQGGASGDRLNTGMSFTLL